MSRSYTEIFVSGKGGRAAVEVSSYGRGRYATATQVTDQLVAAVAALSTRRRNHWSNGVCPGPADRQRVTGRQDRPPS